jgi:hypothetical protein
MTSRFKRTLLSAGVLAAALSGCDATETGNPITQQTLALTARSSSDDVSLGDDSDASLRVESAWILLGDMRFVKSADCDRGSASRVDVEGPQALELVDNRDALDLELEAARYCRVRVRLEKAKDVSGAPAELEDHSIVLRGTRADDREFVVRSRRNFDLDLRSRGDGFDLTGARGAMILAFDVATWLEGVDLEGAEPSSNGAIEIDEQSDRTRLGAFEDNVKEAMELFRDRDRDSKLDDDDLDDSLAGG